jgi:predicted Zn-dependent protease
MGTQILFDSGYDPRAMAQFFEKIEAQQKGGGPVAFFSTTRARTAASSA